MAIDNKQRKLVQLKEEAKEREAQRLAQNHGLEYSDLTLTIIDPEALLLIPEEKVRKAGVAVFQKTTDKLAVALLNPKNTDAQNLIQELKKKSKVLNLFVVSEKSFNKVLEAYQLIRQKAPEITEELFIDEKETDIYKLEEVIKKTDPRKISQIVNYLFLSAINIDASDIHLEPQHNIGIIRMRLDGILKEVAQISPELAVKIKDRLKLLCGLKLNITDVPQDGRLTVFFEKKPIEIRTVTSPSEYGEGIVMRILNPKTLLDLSQLGLRKDDVDTLQKYIKKPNGLILNTGPTGSGKTTTLYAILNQIKNPEIKIITIEDPIEYHLDGITQTQINEERGYTFANALRSVLRQDPDIILVGEIRDFETADMAMQASLTGHLVISTLHTNNSAGAVPRLTNLGAKTDTISPALDLIIAQRLARKICPKCAKEYEIGEEDYNKLKKAWQTAQQKIKTPELEKKLAGRKLKKGEGCNNCLKSGYKGRIGIFEFLEINNEIKKLIYKSPSEVDIFEEARKNGMVTMAEDGLIKILEGLTTVEEVERVLGEF